MEWLLVVRYSAEQKSRCFPFGVGRRWLAGRYADPDEAVARAGAEGCTDPLFLNPENYMPLDPVPYIHRWHFEVCHEESVGPWIRDCDTMSRTRLNGNWLTPSSHYSLRLDDEIQVARCRIHLCGNVHIDSAWLSWKDGCVFRMAQAIQKEQTFAALPILADALEEAGCFDADILNSCRQRNESARRSWVVDLLVGSQ